MPFVRTLIAALCTLIPLKALAQAQDVTTTCYGTLGTAGDYSILLEFESGHVHSYWSPSGKPFSEMTKGADFAAVAKWMKDQGTHDLRTIPGQAGLSFENGFGSTYENIVITGNSLHGRVESRGKSYPVQGTCKPK